MTASPKLPTPAEPSDLTPAWITAALRSSGTLRHGACTSVVATIIGADRGFTGVVARLRLAYDQAGTAEAPPATLIAKLPTATRAQPSAYQQRQRTDPSLQRRAFARANRELAFYREVAPTSPIPTPRLYFAQVDAAMSAIVLLFEDIQDARPGDALGGCTVSEVRAVLTAMARFHARWWNQLDIGFPGLIPGDDRARLARFGKLAGQFLATTDERLPEPAVELIQRLRDRYTLVIRHLNQAPRTLIHADLHLDNVLFTADQDGPGFVLLDWQTVSAGAAVTDVAPFVATSLSSPDRHAHELSILRDYHAELLALGVHSYSWDRFLADYRYALLMRLAGTVNWLAATDRSQVGGREGKLMDAALGDGQLLAALTDHAVDRILASAEDGKA